MSLIPGVRFGPYEIATLIGAGGMGEVYRAIDTNLKRAVAVKVLPESVASDSERLARFQREAEVLAALNHPNIASIYGLERVGSTTALVMELVEGPTLADRIAQGAIPCDEALPIAKQIAEALEAAHEQGIIHRDLKPANIKVRSDGTVKVLDFGLAKAMEPAGVVSSSASMSPTITSPAMMTGVGIILGTAAYMSPEQARGKPVDKRSDIWAFGCVLYEMLTAVRAFDGEDVALTLARVMEREPSFDRLPSSVPARIRQGLRVCLSKDPRQRPADIHDAMLALGGAFETTAPDARIVYEKAESRSARWRRRALLTAGGLGIALISGIGVWLASQATPPPVSRTLITSSGQTVLSLNGNDHNIAITPDGSRIAYRGNGQIVIRALDQLDPTAISGVTNPQGLFISPDGQWVGFFENLARLKKVAITGGPPITVVDSDGSGSRGATWGEDGTIVYATSANGGLRQVSAAGGEPAELTKLDRESGETDHVWPEFLPGGRAVLFTITAVSGGLEASQIAVLDLQTRTRKTLIRGGSDAHYVSTGHLIYGVAGALLAVPFDLARLEIHGTPVPVISRVMMSGSGMNTAVARDGTLVYLSPTGSVVPLDLAVSGVPRTLVWVDRQGRETLIAVPPHTYNQPRLSPDSAHLAVQSDDQDRDVWLWDFGRRTFTRVTFDRGIEVYPVWTSDGRRLIFSSQSEIASGVRNLFWRAADGTGTTERLTESPDTQNPTGVTPDGGRLVFTEIAAKTRDDVMQVTLDGSHSVTPLVQSPSIERNGIVSPDGRWLAYEADDSGRLEIYVRPLPDVNSGRWQVSDAGGERPLWSRDGKELFYVSPPGAIMRVGIENAQSWTTTSPTLAVREGYFTNPAGLTARMYDISADGQRFLMIKNPPDAAQTTATANIVVVQHFDEELKRLVPTK